MESLRESTTLALNAQAKSMALQGETIFNLTAGELASDTPEYIQEHVSTKLSMNKYTPVAGLPELRGLIADSAAKSPGLNWVTSSNVVVTAGAKPALAATFLAILNQGDEVIVPTPAWVSYRHLIELAGGKVIEVRGTDDFDLDVPAIKRSISPRTKAIIINSPNNPTGRIYPKASLLALAETIKGSDIQIISDDIYSKLILEDDYTMPANCGFKNVIIINGFSKSQALTGWRIGYIIAQDEIASATVKLLSHITGNASVISQEAAIVAMQRGDIPSEETLKTLHIQRDMVSRKLSSIQNFKLVIPEGAFYYFIDISKITLDCEKWCSDLLKSKGVAVVPGEAFGYPGCFRLSFVTDQDVLNKALDRIKEFAETKYA